MSRSEGKFFYCSAISRRTVSPWPRLLANLDESTAQTLIFDCDMDTALCASDEDHVHRITHSLSDDGTQLTTTYVSWKDGEHRKESVYVFERKD